MNYCKQFIPPLFLCNAFFTYHAIAGGSHSIIYHVKLLNTGLSHDTGLSKRLPVQFKLIYTINNPAQESMSIIRAFDIVQRLVVLFNADHVMVIRWPDPSQLLNDPSSLEAMLTLSMQSEDLEELVHAILTLVPMSLSLIYSQSSQWNGVMLACIVGLYIVILN